uniref:Uncharacterized protein n=1 Tax=Mustela putorius furo TaxID=9669 RepID=M3YJZ1_MUSPF
ASRQWYFTGTGAKISALGHHGNRCVSPRGPSAAWEQPALHPFQLTTTTRDVLSCLILPENVWQVPDLPKDRSTKLPWMRRSTQIKLL